VSARHLSEAELVAYVDGDLWGAARRSAEAHLAGCPSCSHARHGLETAARRACLLPTVPPPADLRQRLATRLALEPVRPLRCRQARRLLHEALDDEISPFGAWALQLHLDGCAACRAEWAVLCRTTGAVRSLPAVTSPDAVWETVRAAARTPVATVPWGRRLRPAFATVSAAALLLLLRPALQPARHLPASSLAPLGPARTTARPAPPRVKAGPPSSAAPSESLPSPELVAATPLDGLGRTSAPTRSSPVPPVTRAMRAQEPDPSLVMAFFTDTDASPSDDLPRTMGRRVLADVARGAAYDISPHADLASAEERLSTLASETLAESPPDMNAGDSTRPNPESGAAGSTTTDLVEELERAIRTA